MNPTGSIQQLVHVQFWKFGSMGFAQPCRTFASNVQRCCEVWFSPVLSEHKPTQCKVNGRPLTAHWIQMVLALSGRGGSAVRSPKVEKNCSISFCNISFLFSASSLARSAFLSLISTMVYFFFSWSSSSCRFAITVSNSRFRNSRLQERWEKAGEYTF